MIEGALAARPDDDLVFLNAHASLSVQDVLRTARVYRAALAEHAGKTIALSMADSTHHAIALVALSGFAGGISGLQNPEQKLINHIVKLDAKTNEETTFWWYMLFTI